MSKKQLIFLCICHLVPWTIGSGLTPVLPLYATKMGAGPALTGFYLAIVYLSLSTGAIIGGWLSDWLQRRKTILIIAGIAFSPAVWLMGLASNIWQLAVLSAITWVLGGMAITLVNILTGLFADEDQRGKIFGILRLTIGLAFLIGGLTSGPMVDLWGYPAMFRGYAIFSIILPLTGLLLEDKAVTKTPADKPSHARGRTRLTGAIFLLVIAVAISQIPHHTGSMGRSLIMNEKGFATAAISSVMVIEGTISIPLFLLLGWLSDKVGRKRLIGMCYFLYMIGMLVLAFSASLWQFYVFSALRAFMLVSNSVGSALVTDLAPKESLGKGMSLLQAAFWGAGIIGFSGGGYAFQSIGMTSSITLFAFLPLVAIILLIPLREKETG